MINPVIYDYDSAVILGIEKYLIFMDCHESLRDSRNDERVERLYFLRKQNEAKTFARIRATRGFYFFLDTSLRSV